MRASVALYRAKSSYPWLALGIPLRLSRRLGYRVTLAIYEDLIYIGEVRLATVIEREREVAEMRALIGRAIAARLTDAAGTSHAHLRAPSAAPSAAALISVEN